MFCFVACTLLFVVDQLQIVAQYLKMCQIQSLKVVGPDVLQVASEDCDPDFFRSDFVVV